MTFEHKTVLLNESIEALNIRDDGIYVDGTLGGAGHSIEILRKNPTCTLIGIDRDDAALRASAERLSDFSDRAKLIKGNFKDAYSLLQREGIDEIDGLLLDLGVSSHQLDEGERGFSYRVDSRLDMRMDPDQDLDAFKVVNQYAEDKLRSIIYKFSDERWANRIAEFIAKERKNKPIETTFDLVEIIKKAIPHGARREGGHPAKRTFQALRMEVNGELDNVSSVIEEIVPILKTGGRLAIVSFHSIEDRLVKQAFKSMSQRCTCPPDFPVCVCGRQNLLKIITRKPITPSKEELESNSRSASAKLRVAEKI